MIEASCLLGAIAADAGDDIKEALSTYGRSLGIIFQLRDDLLDLEAVPTDGKPVAQDCGRGYFTLPLLHTLAQMPKSTPSGKQLRKLIEKQRLNPNECIAVSRIAERCGGIEHTRQTTSEEAETAITALEVAPDGEWKNALIAIVNALTY